MRRTGIWIMMAMLVLPVATRAGELEKKMKSRWLGAWIVTSVESYSDCSSYYTNNRVNGNLVKSAGQRRFQPGELAKVDKVDLKRSRLDLLVSVPESILVPYYDGPFTLYREVSCRIEFEVEIPRHIVKSKNADWIDNALLNVMERFATEKTAKDSGAWNERLRDEYPEDYDTTLLEHAIWRATEANNAVQAKLDHANDEVMRLADRLTGDPVYLGGFSKGVEEAKQLVLDACPQLMAAGFQHSKLDERYNPEDPANVGNRTVRGHDDGHNLVLALELIRRLPDCFVPLPEKPEVEMAGEYERPSTR